MLRGAWLGANLRSCMRPTAVSPRAELCSRRQCRPGLRQLDGRRHGEKNAVARGRLRQRPKKGRPRKWCHLMDPKTGPKKARADRRPGELRSAWRGCFLGPRPWKRGMRAQGARRRKLCSRRERQQTDTLHTVAMRKQETRTSQYGPHTEAHTCMPLRWDGPRPRVCIASAARLHCW